MSRLFCLLATTTIYNAKLYKKYPPPKKNLQLRYINKLPIYTRYNVASISVVLLNTSVSTVFPLHLVDKVHIVWPCMRVKRKVHNWENENIMLANVLLSSYFITTCRGMVFTQKFSDRVMIKHRWFRHYISYSQNPKFV